jgi:transposase
MGRPRADDGKTLSGILYVLREGCRWDAMPLRYGSPVTCWRRLRAWQADGTWDRIWQALLEPLDKQRRLDLEHAVLDSSTVAAKKGARPLGTPVSAG